MRARLGVPAVIAAIAVMGAGCATGREVRAQAELHAPLTPVHVDRTLETSVGLMLVNPLACFAGGGSCAGDTTGLCALLLVGCAGVLGAVDLVALPVQAIRRHGQVKDLERIGLACPIDDPSARASAGLVDRLVRDFGFTAAPPDAPAASAPGAAPATIHVRVRTTRFERASRIAWNARVELAMSRKVLWGHDCAGFAPAREARTFADECAAAREEVAALADRCVEAVAGDLRRRWPEWDPAPKPAPEPAATEASEAAGVYDPWGRH